ncbi:transglutaminase domain-containing protein [candidate division WOR-3 bacterium]|nr:transglutaminase domain-containing protein [candidate division WOR-3 bacterium]
MTFCVFSEGTDPEFLDQYHWIVKNIAERNLTPEESLIVFNSVKYPEISAERFNWSQPIPEEIWKKYVIYPRLSQEPLEDYRPFFFEILADSLDTCQNARSAVEAIFRWSSSVIKFRQTSRRDQGPLETFYSGYGRCEELMIFSASICRTFGIPAREAFVPYWSFTDNNHAWTEVFIDGDWHYIDEGATLDRAWFSDFLGKTALVLAVSPGFDEGEDVIKTYNDASLVNVTGNYAHSGILTFFVSDESAPVENAKLSLMSYNWGALREIASGFTDSDGAFSIRCGLVSVFVLCSYNGKTATGVFTPVRDDTVTCLLELGLANDLDVSFLMKVK